MARIRTCKPEFFTSEDICELSPLARLLYIGTWLEADREGRLEWKPKTLKTRYLPHDDCDIHTLCVELLARGLVVLYGNGFAYIPTFLEHQVINNKEAKSRLPEPPAVDGGAYIPAVIESPERDEARVKGASLTPLSRSFPSLPSGSLSCIGGVQRGAPLVMSPADHARRLEFCSFVGARLQVPKSLHAELRGLLGGDDPEAVLAAWYESIDAEIEASGESIDVDVFKWIKARYAGWRKATEPPPKTATEIALETLARQKAEARR